MSNLRSPLQPQSLPALLPFETFSPLQPLQIGDISIERYGCLTPSESIALEQIVQPMAIDLSELSALLSDETTRELQVLLASILLICRHSPRWTLAEVKSEFEPEEITQAAGFLLDEQRTWASRPQKSEVNGNGGDTPDRSAALEPMDWGRVFWKLQRTYPSDDRFRADRFGTTPIAVIERALELANEFELERLEAESRAIANVGVTLAAANGAKHPSTRWYNDWESIAFVRGAKATIPTQAAKSYLALQKIGRVPEWVADQLEDAIEMIKAAAA